MNPFERGRALMHAIPARSLEATYTPADGGASVPVHVIRSSSELDTGTAGTWVQSDAVVFSVTTAEIPVRPVKNATIAVGADTWWVYEVKSDTMGLSWGLFCQAVPLP